MTTAIGNKSVELWRVLIARRDGEEILLRADGPTFALPQVVIPTQQRMAANINRAVERELGLHVVSLYELPDNGQVRPSGVFCHSAAVVRPRECTPENTHWTSIRFLRPCSFSDESDFAAVQAFLSGLDAGNDGHPQPFLRPDWFFNVSTWVENAIHPHSRHLTGPFQQLNASSTFSLIRFETDGHPVWFKAVGAPNLRELPITLALARACPSFLPTILASNAEWNAWLAEEAPGHSLSSSANIPTWVRAASSLAHLQILTLPTTEGICRAGSHDLRLNGLASWVLPFLEFVGDCRANSPSQQAEPLRDCELWELGTIVQETLLALDGLHLPKAIGHMDLNPQNIFCSATECVFLDWAETFVGCPFFSFEYLLQHFRRNCSLNSSSERPFRDAYLKPWRELICATDVEMAVTHTPLAALFAYAATLWSSLRTQGNFSDSQQAYLVGLARKMRRMAAKLTRVYR
jgi:Phosphotransferase enzyme family